jgi:hypothetical protein
MSRRAAILVVGLVGLGGTLAALPPDPNTGHEAAVDPAVDTQTAQTDSYQVAVADPVQSQPPKPLFEGWTKPAAVFLLTGQQHGYIEPCGCALVQLGGVSRRANLIKQIENRGWQVVGLDVGGVASERHFRKQSQMKFEKQLAALQSMRYAAVALGVEELRVGPADYLLGVGVNLGDMPFLSANVVLLGSPDVGTPIPKKLVAVGNVKVGVTAIFGQSLKPEVLPANAPANGDITITDPVAALRKVLSGIDKDRPDLRVLLSHAKLDESKKLAETFPDRFDFILSAGGPEDPEAKPIRIGKTLLITTGAKGKHVGVLGFYPNDAPQRFRFELVDMDPDRFKNTPEMDDIMRQYQDELKLNDLVTRERAIAHPTGSTFVGAAICGECHTKSYAKWKTTRHAHGYDSLVEGRPEQKNRWVSRIHDPECLACHVTGWDTKQFQRYDSGFLNTEKTPLLKGNQCENCHGPGSKHVAAERQFKKDKKETDLLLTLREERHLDLELAKQRVCYSCHDGDNSPGFDFKKYWVQIAHPGKD